MVMTPWECDGSTRVATLSDISFDRYRRGVLVSRHVSSKIITQRSGWATVLSSVEDLATGGGYEGDPLWHPPRYTLTRWRKRTGWWELTLSFRLTREALHGVIDLGPSLLQPITNLERNS